MYVEGFLPTLKLLPQLRGGTLYVRFKKNLRTFFPARCLLLSSNEAKACLKF
jgi:hypothetical protein